MIGRLGLGPMLSSLWGCLGASWDDFCLFWELLGCLWWGLGRPWTPLGHLLRYLGRVLGGLEAVLGRHKLIGSFWTQQAPAPSGTWPDLELPKGAKREPKCDPRGFKIDVKNEDEKRRC